MCPLTRLLYRAWQVCQTPNDLLVEKLGLDIPPPPEVTLEEITAREIRIAWKQPEFHNSIHKHIIQVNGAKGTFEHWFRPSLGLDPTGLFRLMNG